MISRILSVVFSELRSVLGAPFHAVLSCTWKAHLLSGRLARRGGQWVASFAARNTVNKDGVLPSLAARILCQTTRVKMFGVYTGRVAAKVVQSHVAGYFSADENVGGPMSKLDPLSAKEKSGSSVSLAISPPRPGPAVRRPFNLGPECFSIHWPSVKNVRLSEAG